jgi:hypothetical protein
LRPGGMVGEAMSPNLQDPLWEGPLVPSYRRRQANPTQVFAA